MRAAPPAPARGPVSAAAGPARAPARALAGASGTGRSPTRGWAPAREPATGGTAVAAPAPAALRPPGCAHPRARTVAPARAAGRAIRPSLPRPRAPRLAPLLALPLAACLGLEGRPPPGFVATLPPLAEPAPVPLAAPPPPTPGAIWRAGHGAGLGVDNRARQVGDIVTIVLAERMAASKESSASAARSSDYALRLPQAAAIAALPAGLFTGGLDTGFEGTGRATQSNRLTGEISVTVAGVLANGALLLRGQKLVRLNRGDEHVQIEGVVRPEDIGPDNRVPSTRVAAARITYAGTGEIAAQARQGWVARLLNFFAPF